MSIQHKRTVGTALATAAAALFITGAAVSGTPTAAHAADGVKCMGINACKGHSECQTASNACNGLNACKGQGWVTVSSAEECMEKGGEVKK
jgi:hypothetical protein